LRGRGRGGQPWPLVEQHDILIKCRFSRHARDSISRWLPRQHTPTKAPAAGACTWAQASVTMCKNQRWLHSFSLIVGQSCAGWHADNVDSGMKNTESPSPPCPGCAVFSRQPDRDPGIHQCVGGPSRLNCTLARSAGLRTRRSGGHPRSGGRGGPPHHVKTNQPTNRRPVVRRG
jgi:hypothetical protein